MVKKTGSWLLIIVIVSLVLCAGLIMAVRFALPQVSAYPVQISAYLSRELNADISIGGIEAHWVQTKPQFKLTKIRILDVQHLHRRIEIGSIVAELDVVQSIFNLAPIFKHLSVDKFSLKAEQIQGRWLTVFSPTTKLNVAKSASLGSVNQLLKNVLNQSQIIFKDAKLVLKPENAGQRTVGPIQFVMQNTEQMHQINGTAELRHYGDDSLVQFAIEAGQLAPKITDTALHIYTNFTNISEQLLALNLWDAGVAIRQLSLDAQLWATLQNGVISDVVGKATINSLYFNNPDLPTLLDSHVNFALGEASEKQPFSLSDIKLSDGQTSIEISAISGFYNRLDNPFLQRLVLSSLDLEAITAVVLQQGMVAEKYKTIFKKLDLKGNVENISIEWSSAALADFTLQADMKSVSAKSYRGAPAVSGVSGRLSMSALRGEFALNTQNFGLSFPQLFDSQWHYKKASGTIAWEIERNQQGVQNILVNSQLLKVSRDELRANGRFSLVLPMDWTKQAELILMLGLQNSQVDDLLNYVPGKIVGQALTSWLQDAALAGHVHEAGFVLRTGLRRNLEESINPSVQLYLNMADTKINFDRKWPNLMTEDLSISYMDGDLIVTSKQGSIASNEMSQLRVEKTAAQGFIEVSALLQGGLNPLFSKLKTKPAIEIVPKFLRGWQLKGKHQSSLALTLPLFEVSEESKAKVVLEQKPFYLSLSSALTGVSVADDELKLAAKGINGKVTYDTLAGLQGNKIALHIFEHPGILSITSKAHAKGLKTSLTLKGKMTTAAVKPWLNSPMLAMAKGSAGFNAKIDFCSTSPNCDQLLINSDLVGMAIDLPKPWGKSESQASKLQILKLPSNGQRDIWRYNYADIVRGVTQLAQRDAGGELDGNASTHIVLGGARPDAVSGTGIYITGTLANMQLDALAPYLSLSSDVKDAQGSAAEQAEGDNFKRLSLVLKNVGLFGSNKLTGKLDFKQLTNHWQGTFSTGIASGEILIPKGKRQSIVLKLNKLHIVSTETKGRSDGINQQISSDLQPKNWPKVKLSIDRLIYNNHQLGPWQASLAPTKKGYKASGVVGTIAGTKISGEIAVAVDSKAVRSFLEMSAVGGDFGALLASFGYKDVLENKDGKLGAYLSWRGYPWSMQQKNLNGRVEFTINKGRIIEAGTSANFLRIFGILNLNTVIKRLKLDFSDLLESGISFDKVTAKYYLQDGIATSQEPLKLVGSSATVEMEGTINFAEQSLEQRMVVAIPLTSNAPLAALLLASPQIAGIAFVVDKLLGKQLAKLTALRYQISGPWSNPKISPVRAK